MKKHAFLVLAVLLGLFLSTSYAEARVLVSNNEVALRGASDPCPCRLATYDPSVGPLITREGVVIGVGFDDQGFPLSLTGETVFSNGVATVIYHTISGKKMNVDAVSWRGEEGDVSVKRVHMDTVNGRSMCPTLER